MINQKRITDLLPFKIDFINIDNLKKKMLVIHVIYTKLKKYQDLKWFYLY